MAHPGPVITRFAPSPTGHLHIGGARTALFCWAFARRNGGHFLLRIEDTDQARSSEESARGIAEDLAWLGIDWDEGPVLARPDGGPGKAAIGGDPRGVGPFFQAQRVALYNRYVMQLVEQGKAYPAFERAEDLETKRKAAAAAKQTYRYDRAALREMPTVQDRLKRMAGGEPCVVRFLAPAEEVVVHDQVLGDVKYAPGEMDDFVIRKADGFPTYHFAVVVDDETMGVTHVLRAQEHLNNTPRHVALQKALGFRTPTYAHMPLIFNMDGTKMSKRDKAKAARKAAKDAMAKDKSITAAAIGVAAGIDDAGIRQFLAAESDSLEIAEAVARHFKINLPEIEIWDFRRSGYLPEAITNFVALLGWNPGMKTADGKDLEKFDNAFIAGNFSVDRIGKTNAKFDRNKLLSFNADAIGAMTDEAFASRWVEWMREYEPEAAAKVEAAFGPGISPRLLLLARSLRPRAKTFRDALRPAAFALAADDGYPFDAAAVDKNLKSNGAAGLLLLRELRQSLAGVAEWSPSGIDAFIETFARAKGHVTEKGVNVGPVAQPLRVALTGTGVSPGLGDTLSVLGREAVLRRIDRCLAECS